MLIDMENKHPRLYWDCLKISYLFIWALSIIGILLFSSACPFPVGICKLYSFTPLFTIPGKVVTITVLSIASVMYVREKYMVFTTALLAVFTCIIISFQESNGIYQRAALLTVIWAAQSFAYLAHKYNNKFNLTFYRQQYVVQIIAASYTLAAVSKIYQSGLSWPKQGAEYLAIQIIKGFSFDYFSSGNINFIESGRYISAFALHHPNIIMGLLTTTLLLEFFCFIAIIKPSFRFVYGIGLLLMHVGIMYAMNIVILPIAVPMAIFFINPLFYLVLGVLRIKQKIAGHTT